jgi:hypothetical protein
MRFTICHRREIAQCSSGFEPAPPPAMKNGKSHMENGKSISLAISSFTDSAGSVSDLSVDQRAC